MMESTHLMRAADMGKGEQVRLSKCPGPLFGGRGTGAANLLSQTIDRTLSQNQSRRLERQKRNGDSADFQNRRASLLSSAPAAECEPGHGARSCCEMA